MKHKKLSAVVAFTFALAFSHSSFAQPAPETAPATPGAAPAAEVAPSATPAAAPAAPAAATATAGSPEANALVAKADAIRVPKGSYQFNAVITSFEGSDKKSENGYTAYVKDLDHSMVAFTTPTSERGKSLLMLGDDLWIYLPNVKKPVRIPLQQRLVGDIANGDITRLNLAGDYNATVAGDENVNGVDTTALNLVAKSDDKTYNKIKYWVSKADGKPVKAEYFTVSGQSLKTCMFEDFRPEAGATRPMRMVFQDSVNKDKKSILVFTDMVTKKLDDNMFTKDYMKTFE
ncbi:MAG TPA: outer membrane lipoprotein-sorting protein [bacterium]|nr:outer membrane lipoprotein-sorting protein [bacterium]